MKLNKYRQTGMTDSDMSNLKVFCWLWNIKKANDINYCIFYAIILKKPGAWLLNAEIAYIVAAY
jgi:hypothetical protein